MGWKWMSPHGARMGFKWVWWARLSGLEMGDPILCPHGFYIGFGGQRKWSRNVSPHMGPEWVFIRMAGPAKWAKWPIWS